MKTTIKRKDKIASLRDAIFEVISISNDGIVNTVCIDSGRSRIHKVFSSHTINLNDIDTPRCNYTLHFIS